MCIRIYTSIMIVDIACLLCIDEKVKLWKGYLIYFLVLSKSSQLDVNQEEVFMD